MIIGKIKCSFPERNFLFSLNECMKVLSAILVILLSNNILDNGMLLLEVLQCCLRGDLTLGVGEEPAFRLNLSIKSHKSILR